MREMTKEYVKYTLEEERLWKEKESDTFTFEKWNVTLTKIEKKYEPFNYVINAIHENGVSTWNRRYPSMEKAFLHIINNFNENANIKNNYQNINEYFSLAKI